MNETLIGGKWEVGIGNVLIPAKLLGDITINYAEGVMEANTQAGVRRQPSGMPETAEATLNIFIPNAQDDSTDYLKVVFGVSQDDPLWLGGGSCTVQGSRPINIHPVCNVKDGKDDFHIPAGLVLIQLNPTLSTSDLLNVEVTIQMQPTTNGYLLKGYPDKANPTYWDVETQAWVSVPTP